MVVAQLLAGLLTLVLELESGVLQLVAPLQTGAGLQFPFLQQQAGPFPQQGGDLAEQSPGVGLVLGQGAAGPDPAHRQPRRQHAEQGHHQSAGNPAGEIGVVHGPSHGHHKPGHLVTGAQAEGPSEDARQAQGHRHPQGQGQGLAHGVEPDRHDHSPKKGAQHPLCAKQAGSAHGASQGRPHSQRGVERIGEAQHDHESS